MRCPVWQQRSFSLLVITLRLLELNAGVIGGVGKEIESQCPWHREARELQSTVPALLTTLNPMVFLGLWGKDLMVSVPDTWRSPQSQTSCVLRAGIPMDALQEGSLWRTGSLRSEHTQQLLILPHTSKEICRSLPQANDRLSNSCRDKRWGGPRCSQIEPKEDSGVAFTGVAFTVTLCCHRVSSHQTASNTSNVI